MTHPVALLQVLLATSADMITVSDHTGRLTYASPATQRVSGYSVTEVLAQHLFDTIHPDDRPACAEAVARLRATPGLSLDLQHRIRHKDGTWYWVEGTFLSLFHDPVVQGLVATVRDITAHKQAEEALRESEAKYRMLFDSIDEGFCTIDVIFDADAQPVDYRFVDINPAFEQQTGITNAVGRRMRDIAPRHEQHWFDIYGRVALTGEPVRFEQRAEQLGRFYDVYAFRTGTPTEHSVGILFNDITTRRQAEVALRASEERFRAIADLVPDLLWSNDPSGQTDWCNQRWLEYTGQTVEEAIGYGWTEAIHPDDRATLRHTFQHAVDRGEPLRQEHRIRHVDGTYRWFLVQAQPRTNTAGQIVCWYGAATDMHQERMALEEAEGALHLRDQFLSIAAHELRTPLTALIGNAELMQKRVARGMAGIERTAEQILRQAQRLNRLVEELLDVSRVQRGQFAIERQPTDVAGVVTGVVEEVRAAQSPDSKHTIELCHPDQPLLVLGDAQRLEHVIVNLLTNAIKYSPAGGPVQVRVGRTATDAIVEVVDQGIGIPIDAHARLFEPFYRASNIGTEAHGFGLGLHIVREIVQRHDGRVEVASTEGQGSTFRVVIPLLRGTGYPPEAAWGAG